jgi:hypothetical protein
MKLERNIVVGSSTIFMLHADGVNSYQHEYFQFDPIGVNNTVDVNGILQSRSPITQIAGTPGLGPDGLSFLEMASRRGIVFLYENCNDKPDYEVKY